MKRSADLTPHTYREAFLLLGERQQQQSQSFRESYLLESWSEGSVASLPSLCPGARVRLGEPSPEPPSAWFRIDVCVCHYFPSEITFDRLQVTDKTRDFV